jgi:hypothetical protein
VSINMQSILRNYLSYCHTGFSPYIYKTSLKLFWYHGNEQWMLPCMLWFEGRDTKQLRQVAWYLWQRRETHAPVFKSVLGRPGSMGFLDNKVSTCLQTTEFVLRLCTYVIKHHQLFKLQLWPRARDMIIRVDNGQIVGILFPFAYVS